MKKVVLAGCCLLLLNGCVVVQIPVGDIMAGIASGPSGSSGPVGVKKLALQNVCIELNSAVTVDDLLPAVQDRLRKYGVETRVFEPGTEPVGCDATLYYTATREWDSNRVASSEALPYMNFASLTLRRNGKMISSANYELKGLGFGKWSSTSTKIGPVVDALVAGN